MSIASEVSRIIQAKTDIKTAIEAKGVTVPNGALLGAYPALIDGISGGGGAPGVGTAFTGATCPVTFKGNTNIYENEWEYKSDGALTITGLDSVATITGNGTNHVKVLFDVTSSTSSITLFNINVGDKTFVGRFFYYGEELTANQCLAVASLIAPESGVGVLDVNFKFIVSTSYPLFSSTTTIWQMVYSHQIIGFIFGKRTASIGDSFMRQCYSFNQPLTIPSGVTSIGTYFMYNCYALTLISYEPDVYPTDNNALSQTANSKTSANGTGIKIIGANAAGLKEALPDRTVSPFRKLV